ncbi:MAG: hypothetical protein ACJ8DC_06140 [Gemmatimonadales bacterium]
MTDMTAVLADYEPDLGTVELVCERLGEIGHQIGPDTARSLIRAIVQREALRVDARMREAIETSLQTIKVAAQSAIGVLAATTPVQAPPGAEKAATPAPAAAADGRRPIAKRKPPPEPPEGPSDGERRPVFRRPRGR